MEKILTYVLFTRIISFSNGQRTITGHRPGGLKVISRSGCLVGGTNLRRYSVSIGEEKRTKTGWTQRGGEKQTEEPKVKGAVYPWKRSNGSAGIRKNDKSPGGSPRSFVVASDVAPTTLLGHVHTQDLTAPTPFFHLAIRKKSTEERSAPVETGRPRSAIFTIRPWFACPTRGRKSKGSGCWRIAVYGQERSEWNRHFYSL